MPVEEGLVSILHTLEHFPLADVVRTDSRLDDLVVGILLGPGRPALLVLLHDHLLLVLDGKAIVRSKEIM